MALTEYLNNINFALPASEWGITTGFATCSGNAATFTDTDPTGAGRTGLLDVSVANDMLCGNFASGTGSNALAQVGSFEWGPSGKAMIAEPAIGPNLFADVTMFVKEFAYQNLAGLINPLAHFWGFLDLGLQEPVSGNWLECEILLFHVGNLPLVPTAPLILPNVTGGSSHIVVFPYVWSGAGGGEWKNFTRIPIGDIARLALHWWAYFNYTSWKVKGVMVGVESTHMRGRALFDKARLFFDDSIGTSGGGAGANYAPRFGGGGVGSARRI